MTALTQACGRGPLPRRGREDPGEQLQAKARSLGDDTSDNWVFLGG